MKYRLLFLPLIAAVLFSCNSHHSKTSAPAVAINSSIVSPAVISYDVVNIYPHDPAAFTEGLQYTDGFLYESSGEYGVSDIRKTEITSGKVIQLQKLENQYFGEGITILNGKIYQLTYREKKGFVYDLKTMKQEKTFTYNTSEGWGMTTDGINLIYSDGSDHLIFFDPIRLVEVKRLNITDDHGAVANINELEYIKGYVYANIWQQDIIIKIDLLSGKVVGRVDLSDIRQKMNFPALGLGGPGAPEVLNGIAYDSTGNRIFITGKYWPKLLEITLDK